MSRAHSRRCFLQLAAAAGSGLCLGAPTARADGCEQQMAALRSSLSLEFQKRQVRDRMVLFDRLIDAYGTGVVVLVEASTVDETAKRFAGLELESRDLSAVKNLLWDNMGEGFAFECIEDRPERLEYRVTRCFLAEEVAAHGRADLGYAFYCAWDVGFCRGLNPTIRFTRTKTLMTGGSCCNHTYEL